MLIGNLGINMNCWPYWKYRREMKCQRELPIRISSIEFSYLLLSVIYLSKSTQHVETLTFTISPDSHICHRRDSGVCGDIT